MLNDCWISAARSSRFRFVTLTAIACALALLMAGSATLAQTVAAAQDAKPLDDLAAAPPLQISDYPTHCVFVNNGKLITAAHPDFFHPERVTDLDAMFTTLARDKRNQTIVIHIHGGLVPDDSALASAAKLSDNCYGTSAYPIFFIWNSDLLSIASQLTNFNNRFKLQKREEEMLTATVQKDVFDKGGSASNDQPIDDRSLQLVRKAKEKLNNWWSQAIADKPAELQTSPFETKRDADNIIVRVMKRWNLAQSAYGSNMSPQVKYQILSRIYKDESLRSTEFAAYGVKVWAQMKSNAEVAFQPAGGAGTAFVAKLRAYLANAQAPTRVVLVGHSAGAIYACHMLDALLAAGPSIPARHKIDVVFIAPACDFKLLSATLGGAQSFIEGLRIFGLSDPVESASPLTEDSPFTQGLYTGSLLYLVSGLAETTETGAPDPDHPLVGMQRYYRQPDLFSQRSSTVSVNTYLDRNAGTRVWSKSRDGNGRNAYSIYHGKFVDDGDTLASLRYILHYGLSP